ncbi:hypothetical protein HAX54_010492 [Datura stramonium]|uniref:Uncharacterized protein n=1 Tax=Datura stramonium TaxID=4076 RepID=A0ABS8TJ20_DATST|nr:hypothetical protein [Datura stramonium]
MKDVIGKLKGLSFGLLSTEYRCSGNISETAVAGSPALQQNLRDSMSADDAYLYVWRTDTTLATPFWCRFWQDEVRLGLAVTQR